MSWILCKDRAPTNRGFYLIQDIYDVIRIATYHGNYWISDGSWKYIPADSIVAWQPLPMLYRSKREKVNGNAGMHTKG